MRLASIGIVALIAVTATRAHAISGIACLASDSPMVTVFRDRESVIACGQEQIATNTVGPICLRSITAVVDNGTRIAIVKDEPGPVFGIRILEGTHSGATGVALRSTVHGIDFAKCQRH